MDAVIQYDRTLSSLDIMEQNRNRYNSLKDGCLAGGKPFQGKWYPQYTPLRVRARGGKKI